MAETARLFLCARCRVQVAICRHCDRGQRYCGQACAQAARGESLRRAGARYQRGRRGRLRHAERQGRYRARRRKVTHQGSPAPPAGASLAPESRAPTPPPGEAVLAGVRCRFCGRACSEFLRPGFLRPPRDGPWVHWPPPARAQSPGARRWVAHREEATMTIPAELEAKILRFFHVEQWKVGTIARQLGVHHGTVDRVLSQAGLPKAARPHRASLIDPYLPFVRETLEHYPSLTASRLYAMVRERGYRGGEDHFRHLIAHHRPGPQPEA